MTPALIHHLVDTTAAIFGITPDQVRSPSRKRPCVIARNIVVDIAYNDFLFKYNEIGSVINRTHGTLIKNKESYQADIKAIPELKYIRREVFNKAADYLLQMYGGYICD